MTHARHTARLAAAALLPAIIVAACGGSAGSPGAGEAVPSTGVRPSGIAIPSIDLPSDGTLPSFAIPSFDLGSLVTNLEGVDSYKIAIVSTGQDYTGTIVTKPTAARDLYVGTSESATHVVTIGDEAWIGQGTGPLKSAPNEMVAALIPLFDPGVLLSLFANASVLEYAENLGEQTKNDQPTTHYKVDVSKLPNMAALGMPATATIEMWVADDGYLVSFVATDVGQAGSNLMVDVTNVNDPANVVARP